MGGQALAVVADVTKDGDIEELIGQTVNAFGGIDVLVNNAGYTWDGVLHKMTDEQWDAIIAIHLTAIHIREICTNYDLRCPSQIVN